MINAVIIGASGYTGVELARLLPFHPEVRLVALCANQKAGQGMQDIYPHLEGLNLPALVSADAVDWKGVHVAFCCLPHGTSQEVIAAIPDHVKVVDLSADFRLRDAETYAQWYGGQHKALHLQEEAVYGLTEHYREAIKKARLVACPGCYPTSALLPLIPLLQAGLIQPSVIIDAKSGVTGAGRTVKEAMLYSEVNESMMAYGIGSHRHTPEIMQELTAAAEKDVTVTFTPHLAPMNRGILSTIYVSLAGKTVVDDLRDHLHARYLDEPFVHVLPVSRAPSTRGVRGSNHVQIGVFSTPVKGQAILVSAIDNLVKGSSGQAIQNMNLMFGLKETMGLEQLALFP